MSTNDHESTSIDFAVTNKFYQVGKFTNKRSVNNEDWLYLTKNYKTLLNLSLAEPNEKRNRVLWLLGSYRKRSKTYLEVKFCWKVLCISVS